MGSSTSSRKGNARVLLAASAAVSVLGLASNQADAAQAIYWDTNGAVAGAGGPSPSGTWNTITPNFTTSAGGTAATIAWPNNSTVKNRFAAGTDATAAYTVTVSGTVDTVQIGVEGEL